MRVSTFLFSIVLFYLFDYFLNLKFKNYHYFIFLFIATTGILFNPLYQIYPNYDKVLHFFSPILFSILVFFLVNKMNAKLPTKLLVTFAVTVSFLTLFEIGEFLLDKLFEMSMQGVYIKDISEVKLFMDKNDDTMIDLILGSIGSLIFVVSKGAVFCYNKTCEILKKNG